MKSKLENLGLYSILPINSKLICFSSPKFGYAYTKDSRIDLISGEVENYSIEDFRYKLSLIKLGENHNRRVIHLSYDYSLFQLNLLDNSEEILAIDIQYNCEQELTLSAPKSFSINEVLAPTLKSYLEKFQKVMDHLADGDCYQMNLTEKFLFSVKGATGLDIVTKLWSQVPNRGEYGHFTFSEVLQKSIISNSPECLFQTRPSKNKDISIWSMPIKGSLKVGEDDPLGKNAFKNLLDSKKDKAELLMITDLIKNDLISIQGNLTKVDKLREKLLVPGLVHTYSLVSSFLGPDVNLEKVVSKIFPGGSITGAPKNNVISLLKKIENLSRGFYCGSTIIGLGTSKFAASINIRTAIFDSSTKELSYGSGGGVTALSEAKLEYEELLLKKNSFMDLLTVN